MGLSGQRWETTLPFDSVFLLLVVLVLLQSFPHCSSRAQCVGGVCKGCLCAECVEGVCVMCVEGGCVGGMCVEGVGVESVWRVGVCGQAQGEQSEHVQTVRSGCTHANRPRSPDLCMCLQ